MFSVDSSPEQSKIMGNDIFGSSVTSTINRKKPLEGDGLQTELKRCLTTSDLTVFGYGQMMGSGLYVVTGIVLHDIAGPAAFLCFLLSGLVALLNALCYAECATLIPNAGSTYAYTYVTMGEIWAFLVGWNIALDYVMGGAAVARGFSGAISSLLNERYANWSVENLGEIYSFGSRINYPDLIAVLCVIIVAIFNIIGAKFTIMMNNVGSFVNTCCILVIVIAGMVVTKHYGWEMFMSSTAFIPFGVEGVVAGTAVCFNAYQGYEAIAVAGEEATNPRRSIPIATVTSVLFTTLVYVLSAFTLSRMVPYNQVDTIAPFPQAFAATGFTWIKTVVAIGSIVGISNALISDLFSGPRTIYAMATDGLVWKPLGVVNVVTQIPLYATIACAAVTITVALFLDSHALVEITSIGVLLSAFMVSVNVLLLRYQTMQESPFKLHELRNKELQNRDDTALLSSAQEPEDIGNLKRKYRYLYYLRVSRPWWYICQLQTVGGSWWRHQMETITALLALCAGNSPVPGEFPAQRPMTRSFDVFFDLCPINDWVNNREAGDLRRSRAHYDVTVMFCLYYVPCISLDLSRNH